MNVVRNIVAIVVGLVVGSVINMAIVVTGLALIPRPAGADLSSAEGFKAALPLLQPRHYLMPFLAHAIGTLAGAFASALIARHRTAIAYTLGAVFLLGGIAAALMIPAPAWFLVLDLVVAYLPMAWIGLRLAERVKPRVGVTRQ